jgi:pilus assembly protein CpaE
MWTLVVSDEAHVAGRVRDWLLSRGLECPAVSLVGLACAADRAGRAELAVLVLAPEPERALAALGELHGRLHCPILAVGPVHDSRLILRALRSGAVEYLDEADLENELDAALDRLRAAAAGPSAVGRLVVFLGAGGGCGASTVAVNVAAAWARSGLRPLLLDLRYPLGDLASLLDLAPAYTLADLCQNAGRLDRNLFRRLLAGHSCGVQLLASPRSFRGEPVTADAVRRALTLGREAFPLLAADLDHAFRDEQLVALRQADLVALVLRLEFTALRNARRILEHLCELGVARERILLIANRAGQAQEVPTARVEQALSVRLFHSVPDDPATANRAANLGAPVVLEAGSSHLGRSLAQLSHKLQESQGVSQTQDRSGAETTVSGLHRSVRSTRPALGSTSG